MTISGYEEIYKSFLEELEKVDFEKKAKTKGLTLINSQTVTVNFFERIYEISKTKGLKVIKGKETSFNHLSAIVNYIISDDEIEPSYNLIPLGYGDATMVGRNNYDQMTYKRPILKRFGANYKLLAEACQKIGGTYEGLDSSGGHSWFFLALPKVPMRLIYHEADEEFTADLQLLFDSVTIKFVEFSCSCSLPSFFVEALMEAAEEIENLFL